MPLQGLQILQPQAYLLQTRILTYTLQGEDTRQHRKKTGRRGRPPAHRVVVCGHLTGNTGTIWVGYRR